jgi:hypothetical protein
MWAEAGTWPTHEQRKTVAAGRENPEPKMLSGKNESLAQAETKSCRQKLLMAVRETGSLKGKMRRGKDRSKIGCGDGWKTARNITVGSKTCSRHWKQKWRTPQIYNKHKGENKG